MKNAKIFSMADGKISFLLYCDLLHTVEHLTDEQAGKLFKHVLLYVNDKDPQTSDPITNISFEPIKQQLKRDLRKWDQELKQRRKAGKKGGIKSGESRRSEAKRRSASKNEANEADTVFVPVTVTVNKREGFAPPSKEDVVNEMMLKLDDFSAMAQAQKFMDHYESKGWIVGKTKMKDWKASVRGWVGRMSDFKKQNGVSVDRQPDFNIPEKNKL